MRVEQAIVNRVEEATKDIINEKRSKGLAPYQASNWEILERMAGATRSELLEAMRELHRQRKFIAQRTINDIPLLVPMPQTLNTSQR